MSKNLSARALHPHMHLLNRARGWHTHCHTPNRPEKLNAYSLTMGRELRAVFERANQDDAVRVIIVTGGGRGFCLRSRPLLARMTYPHRIAAYDDDLETRIENRFIDAIFNCNKPSIAAINGPAVGVGITMTLPMRYSASCPTRRGLIRLCTSPRSNSGVRQPHGFCRRIVGLPQAAALVLGSKYFYNAGRGSTRRLGEASWTSPCRVRASSPSHCSIDRRRVLRGLDRLDPASVDPRECRGGSLACARVGFTSGARTKRRCGRQGRHPRIWRKARAEIFKHRKRRHAQELSLVGT